MRTEKNHLRPNRRSNGSLERAALCLWLVSGFAMAQGPPDIVWSVAGHTGAVNTVSFAPDGATFATGGNDRTVKFWRVSDAALAFTITNHDTVMAVRISPAGDRVAVMSDLGPMVAIYELPGGQRLWQNRLGRSVAFSPDGCLVAISEGGSDLLQLFGPDGTFLRTLAVAYYGFSSIAFSPDGTELAAGQSGLLEFRILNVTDGSLLRRVPLGGSPLLYSPDRKLLAAASVGHVIQLIDPSQIVLQNTLEGHRYVVLGMAFSPNGKILLSCANSPSGQDNTIRAWHIPGGRVIRIYDQEVLGVKEVAVSPNGRYFAYGRSDGTVVLARMPIHLSEIRRTETQTVLVWEGVTGPYQVQQTTHLRSGVWENVGSPTTNTTATVNTTNTNVFFRVQSLEP